MYSQLPQHMLVTHNDMWCLYLLNYLFVMLSFRLQVEADSWEALLNKHKRKAEELER